MNKDEQRMIYGYDDLHHEKYYCSVDYFIDYYKDFAKDGLTFRLFHSEQERDEYAKNSVMEDADNLDLMLDAYMDSMKEINLDKFIVEFDQDGVPTIK